MFKQTLFNSDLAKKDGLPCTFAKSSPWEKQALLTWGATLLLKLI